ncbi:MAG: hypothetical protein HY047_18325 [Acidobacteria bacterium]|nr:hypothetical protein [Acidobacteriota bacterium]
MRPSVFKFFALLLRPRLPYLIVAGLVLALGVYLEWIHPDGFEQVVAIALFLQLFAASSGYRERLRRGHFDAILAGRNERWSVAAVHWVMSAGFGLMLWFALGMIDLAGRTGHVPAAFSVTGLVVFLYVSTVAWAVTLPLPKYSGAILWLALLFGLGATQRLHALRQTFSAAGGSWGDTFHSAASSLVCPIFLMVDPPAAGRGVLSLVFLATVVVWLVGAALIHRFDGVLVES